MKPNINIHNYEEYFLLYADGELSVEEMATVEGFVNKHPELQAALDTLLHSKLSVDDKIVFADKDSLFKTEEVGITINNYEEYFLLYVDDELNDEQKNETEKFVLQHPALQNEFTLLKQTLLRNEAVTFLDKESLYRKETVERSIVSISWKRLAVAASVAGLIFAVWNFYPKTSNIVKQPATIAKAEPRTENKNNGVAINHSSSVINKSYATGNDEQKNVVTVAHVQRNNQAKKIIPVSNVDAAGTKTSDNNDFVTEDEPRINRNEIAIVQSGKTIQPARMIQQLPNQKLFVAIASTMNKEQNILNNERDTDIYVANIRINKNKISNFLKRAKSIINLSGNEDNNNSIAIANFSISK